VLAAVRHLPFAAHEHLSDHCAVFRTGPNQAEPSTRLAALAAQGVSLRCYIRNPRGSATRICSCLVCVNKNWLYNHSSIISPSKRLPANDIFPVGMYDLS
jgi:hypothetical protein